MAAVTDYVPQTNPASQNHSLIPVMNLQSKTEPNWAISKFWPIRGLHYPSHGNYENETYTVQFAIA